ncbi:dTDP-glucose 4,6-dehydratase [Pseudoalteromonas rubra]|uniref:dTDP-glucose 4,6-dehydratase n=1 Tax=Pseudoalteromonas rubra TaxID=43658 RepID=UPI000F7AD9F3|nr:GDP-mannose 4,6-dehydratase [Pseudoalteromonas rubra]
MAETRVLITGGAGFIAHHLVLEILRRTDWHITTLDRLDYSGNLNRLKDALSELPPVVTRRVKIVFHDLKAALNPQIIQEIGQVDYVFHLAAGSHVDRSIAYPMSFVLDNVVGTCNILDFARTQDNLKQFFYFSTDEVFGPAPADVRYKENDRYNSTNPYSATKAGGEELAVAYHNTYKVPVVITHTMNVFGQRQHPEKFIPQSIRKIQQGETVTIHSDKTCTIPGSRFYIHAQDVADALLFLVDTNCSENADNEQTLCPKFNIVGARELNNLELAQIIAQVQNKPLHYELVDFHSSRPGHDLRYALCGEKMKQLGWSPKVDLLDRLEQVVHWTLLNPRWY